MTESSSFHRVRWLAAALLALASLAQAQTGTRYIVTNDDLPQFLPNTVTFYTVGTNSVISEQMRLQTGGYGIQGGLFALRRVRIIRDGDTDCVYASNAWSGDISGITLQTQTVQGIFLGSPTDDGTMNGIGLAVNEDRTYLYAGYTTSNTIGAFSIASGCGLTYIASVPALGLNGGGPNGMVVRGNLLVVAYADGSIESFNVGSGVPISNGDKQNTPAFSFDNLASDVQITKDGHYAIFGDNSVFITLEVSDLSAGKLAAPVVYELKPAANSTNARAAFNSTNILLSPDETLLYVANNASGQITAAFFNRTTGVISPGCRSNTLKSFTEQWAYASGLAVATDAGTGGQLYVADFGAPSFIGVVNVQSSGTQCALHEDAQSPVINANSPGLISLDAYTAK